MITWRATETASFYEEDRPDTLYLDRLGSRVTVVVNVDRSKHLKMCRLRVTRSDNKYGGKAEVLRIKYKSADILSNMWAYVSSPYHKVTILLRGGGVLALTSYLGVEPLGKPQLLEPAMVFKTSIFARK